SWRRGRRATCRGRTRPAWRTSSRSGRWKAAPLLAHQRRCFPERLHRERRTSAATRQPPHTEQARRRRARRRPWSRTFHDDLVGKCRPVAVDRNFTVRRNFGKFLRQLLGHLLRLAKRELAAGGAAGKRHRVLSVP